MKRAAAVRSASEKAIWTTTRGLRGRKRAPPPDDIIPGMLLQIANDAITRKLARRAEGERNCA
jgi:hypothetical protein